MDETMLAVLSKKVKVYFPRDLKYPKVLDRVKSSMHITLLSCIGADGTSLPVTAILPLKHFPRDLEPIADSYAWAGQASGWIDEAIWRDWVLQIFIPHVNAKRQLLNKLDEPAFLWVDGHSSRVSPVAAEALEMNNITVATIPAHTSHILQPLDRGVFRAFKESLTTLRRKIPKKATAAEIRFGLLNAGRYAWHHATFIDTVKAAWKEAGIFPWDPRKIRDDPSKVNQTGPAPRVPTRGPQISGRIIVKSRCPQAVTHPIPTTVIRPAEVEPTQAESATQGSEPMQQTFRNDASDSMWTLGSDPFNLNDFFIRREQGRDVL